MIPYDSYDTTFSSACTSGSGTYDVCMDFEVPLVFDSLIGIPFIHAATKWILAVISLTRSLQSGLPVIALDSSGHRQTSWCICTVLP